MLKNTLKRVALMMVFVFSVAFLGALNTEAKTLKVDPNPNAHTAIMVVEDFSNKKQVTVDDVSSVGKESQAMKWYKTHAIGRNVRYVSTDFELIQAWKGAIIKAGGKPENPEEDYRKISIQAKEMLETGKTLYSFETKFIKPDKSKQAQTVASLLLGGYAAVKMF